MTRDQVLKKLQEHKEEIRQFGVTRLCLFGSFARGSQNEQSDVDFVVEFKSKSFDAYMDLKLYLESLLGRRVDLVLMTAIKPRLKSQILNELVDAA